MQQDPNAFQTMKPQFGEPEHLKCPRCDSTNTKFCYYNNYNLSQPRHFCKSCRRYWTKGGSLRNIPVGGGTRKNHNTKQRSSNSKKVPPSPSSSSSSITSTTTTAAPVPLQMVPKPEQASLFAVDQDRRLLDIPGSFSSLLASNGQFGSLLDTMNSSTSSVPAVHFGDFPMVENSNLNTNEGMESIGDPALEMGDSSCWAGANEWPDLAIYTPGSSFQ